MIGPYKETIQQAAWAAAGGVPSTAARRFCRPLRGLLLCVLLNPRAHEPVSKLVWASNTPKAFD